MSYIKIDIIREIDRWYIVTDGQRYGFAWNVRDNQVSKETDLDGESGVEWYKTRAEAESAMLDSFEEEQWHLFEMPELLNTTQVGELLAELTGENWDKRKVSVYRGRGTRNFPKPDSESSGTPLWFRETIENYAEEIEKGC